MAHLLDIILVQSHIIPFRPLDYVDSCVDLPEGVYLKTEEQFESFRSLFVVGTVRYSYSKNVKIQYTLSAEKALQNI